MKVWYTFGEAEFESLHERDLQDEVFCAIVEDSASIEDFCEVVALDRSIDLKRSTLKVYPNEKDDEPFFDPEDPMLDITTSRTEYLYVEESVSKRKQGKLDGSGEIASLAGIQKMDVSAAYLRNFIAGDLEPLSLSSVDDLKDELVAPIPSIIAVRGSLTGAYLDSSVLPLREETGAETKVHARLCRILLAAYETPPPSPSGTDADTAAFAQSYTGLLWRAIDNLVVLLGLESACDTKDTDSCAPQYCLWVKDALLFKAEHKACDSELGQATANLVEKMAGWNKYAMRDIPFLPCYAASGTMIQFFAISPPDLCESILRIEPVTERFDLSLASNRLHVLRIALNMTRVLYALREEIDNPLLKLYCPVKNGNRTTVTLFDDHVSKICVPAPDQIYDLLGRDAEVPELSHVEHVFKVQKLSKQSGMAELKIKQFCVQIMPQNEFSLKGAISSVLKALGGLHAKGFAHRNICWANVLQTMDALTILSNFEFAGRAGDIVPAGCVDEGLLPPESRNGQPYHCAGDIWQVGSLILRWRGHLSDHAREFAGVLMAKTGERPSAQQALDHPWMKISSAASFEDPSAQQPLDHSSVRFSSGAFLVSSVRSAFVALRQHWSS